ncbi:BNR-4 repeat-containing protein [Aliiglaciecola sp. 3_MG-2023]|uniref:BNR-4 repeat-containing protein n=1 Tax=Aliiglaciecola sp. 3_MG-2023 TaxID=3062644 RepID=UPI0026E2B7D3|nr:BNR-4 repeat-containing protein [Aliiglaciecola sp. 3_MG-2023]MDO6693298.1 BNR-4 repeat-containing protein [Aliiglaciecola sp. 3_MG-2023]
MKKNVANLTLALIVACSSLLSACNNQVATKSHVTSEKVDYFADNAFGNALAIVQHPAGVHANGITYVSYQGPLEDPYVASYNHKTGEWKGPFKAGVSEMGKDPSRPKIDNHGKPTMLIDDLGYIHIFFGGHGGMPKHGKNPLGNHHYGRNKHVVTKNPGDISQWQELDNIPAFGTYNQAVKMDNGDIYLFYRHGAHRSDWVYQKSTDHGRTFAAPVSFLKHKKRDDIKADDSWYAWVSKGKDNDIIVSYDYHVCWNNGAGINGRGHTTERHDAYYMVFDTEQGTWHNVKDESVNIPVTREVANDQTLVARTGADWTFNGSAHIDENGYPHIATNIGIDLGQKIGGPKQTSYFRWTGTEWIGGSYVNPQSRIDNTDSRGDFFFKSANEVTFALGYQQQDDGVIAYFTSVDGGETFEKEKELLRRKGANWALTAIIENAHPEARMIVAEKQKGSNWHKLYLLGDSGPVKRLKQDASLLN